MIVNHGWRKLTAKGEKIKCDFFHNASVLITFLAVTIAWVPFRATNIQATLNLWTGMVGINGVLAPNYSDDSMCIHCGNFIYLLDINLYGGIGVVSTLLWITLGFFIIWFMPNTQTWIKINKYAMDFSYFPSYLAWNPTILNAFFCAIIFTLCFLSLNKVSSFLYFQF